MEIETGVKPRRGRPPDPDKLKFEQVGLRPAQKAWLAKWRDTDNVTTQLQELLDRAMKFWPGGPGAFGRTVKQPRKRLPRAALNAYAEKHDLTRQEAIAEIVTKFLAESSE